MNSNETPEHGLEFDLASLPEVVELDTPRDGVPAVVDTPEGLRRAAEALAAGTGPAGVDAERASGFRYGQRAFLIQIRREGAGTWLIDPEPFDDLTPIQEALKGAEWILHAATQDLPCLSELGLWPERLFDTELAARLAGLPRVGLAAVVEQLLGFGLAKEHSAADWSTRPLPESWLRYAALDVEVLNELREELVELLEGAGKLDWAEQEFAALVAAGPPPPRAEPWRRTSGLHQLRQRKQLAVVRELWQERDALAQHRDVAPGRLLPDSALIAAAKALPTTVPQLLLTQGFHGRAAKREAPRWLRAITEGKAVPAEQQPPLHLPSTAPPPPRAWPDKNPQAAARLTTGKARISALAESLEVPVENLLTPDFLRRLAWQPPEELSLETLGQGLAELGARPWQVELCAPVLLDAFVHPDPLEPAQKAPATASAESAEASLKG
ncbi:HRDC domain-containing protein [Acaricomes phytoseiuli]|uniref:HRDC domain-containing protein n=1 Tax=Acaricomes phytoseiuli TaxID=291968 RepID=UPI00036D9EC5|nr:HRDC domain-containing protein [Acaricomes phytoseiuli]MCW1250380.1 HRDC domain-containing protein [Acaricomes phytoseiuli]